MSKFDSSKLSLLKKITSDLFDTQILKNKQDLDVIFDKNNKAHGIHTEILVYKGHSYRRYPRTKSWANASPLHISLSVEMENVVNERTALCDDRRKVEEWLRLTMNHFPHVDGFINKIPECLANYSYSVDKSKIAYIDSAELQNLLHADEVFEIIQQRKLINLLLGSD